MILECVGVAFIYAQMTCTEVKAPPPVAVCPPMVEWSPGLQARAADEMAANPGSALAEIAIKAIQQRDILRACKRARSRR